MDRRDRGKPRFVLPALQAGILALMLVAGLVGPGRLALAQEDGIVTLRGDPVAEAAERESLFADLAKAANAAEAAELAAKIWSLWFRAPNAEAAALMTQALGLNEARDFPGAVAVLEKLVESEPGWAEAWNRRATIRYLMRDYEGSLADIDRVLALEPKHFGALSGQAMILMHQGKMEAGQLALRKAVEIDPFLSMRALLMRPQGRDI
jgi:tetratricopeptide (TPR) repeat protein